MGKNFEGVRRMKLELFSRCLKDISELNGLDEVESASILLAVKAGVCFIDYGKVD